MKQFLANISVSSIYIKILQTVNWKSIKGKPSIAEMNWIKTLFNQGHPLLNEHHVPSRNHMVSVDWIDQLLKRMVYNRKLTSAQHKAIMKKFDASVSVML